MPRKTLTPVLGHVLPLTVPADRRTWGEEDAGTAAAVLLLAHWSAKPRIAHLTRWNIVEISRTTIGEQIVVVASSCLNVLLECE